MGSCIDETQASLEKPVKKFNGFRLLAVAPAALLFLIVIDCQVPSFSPSESKANMIIILTKSLGKSVAARDLTPGIDLNVVSFSLSGTGPSPATFSALNVTPPAYTALNLVPGAWTVTAIGMNAAGVAIVQASQTVTLVAGQTSDVTLNCMPISGNGTLSLDLSWPAGGITAPAVKATLVSLGGTSQSLAFTINGPSASWTSSALPNGYYTLMIQLQETSGATTTLWGRAEMVLVLAGDVTTGSWSLSPSDLAFVSGGINVAIGATTNPPIAITLFGNTASLVTGSTMTVTASASVPPDSWQWFLNGSPIANATNASVTIGDGLTTGPCWLDVVAYKGGSAGSTGCQIHVVSQAYTTSFPLAENPISENGNWMSGQVVGLDWFNVVTTPGLATGEDSPVAFSDPTAILTGTWGSNQTAQATVYSVNQTENYNQEVELRLRNNISAHSVTGYEITFRCLQNADAYMQIVRWNGPLGSFEYLANYGGAQYGVTSGDVVRASIVGNVITVYKNGVKIGSATDGAISTGNPGIGFNYGCGPTYGDFGLTNFTASSP
jgi:hypothetical protein